MKIVILTEGGRNIGFGHIVRCSALADELRSYETDVKFIVNGDSSVEGYLNSYDYSFCDWYRDTGRYIEGTDIVIVDSYIADLETYRLISERTRLAVYIDDNGRIEYPEGVVLNGNIYGDKIDYKRQKEFLLTGIEYALLRKEFRDIPEHSIKKKIENILVTFGGDDSRNMTSMVVGILSEEFPAARKNVVIGASFSDTDKVKEKAVNNTSLIKGADALQMKRLMTESDIAVSAAGQTVCEMAAAGIPAALICIADNQKRNLRAWTRTGFAENAGCADDEDIEEKLRKALRNLSDLEMRKKKSLMGQKLVDGSGAPRAARAILSMAIRKGVSLREVVAEDIEQLYDLANDDEVRKNSFNSNQIEWDEHTEWFKNVINDEYYIIYIAEIEGELIGLVRFELNEHTDDVTAIVSISLMKRFRGLGLAVHIMNAALKRLGEAKTEINEVLAYVKNDNEASKRLFERAGFRKNRDIAVLNSPACEYVFSMRKDIKERVSEQA